MGFSSAACAFFLSAALAFLPFFLHKNRKMAYLQMWNSCTLCRSTFFFFWLSIMSHFQCSLHAACSLLKSMPKQWDTTLSTCCKIYLPSYMYNGEVEYKVPCTPEVDLYTWTLYAHYVRTPRATFRLSSFVNAVTQFLNLCHAGIEEQCTVHIVTKCLPPIGHPKRVDNWLCAL